MMTRKFNTIAEGFDRAEEKHTLYTLPHKTKEINHERAARILRKQPEAEVKMAKSTSGICFHSKTNTKHKAVHTLNKILHESLTQAAFINAFYKRDQE